MSSSRPSWHRKVKEVSLDEAELLAKLGVDVFYDWRTERDRWSRPWEFSLHGDARHARNLQGEGVNVFIYIRKGPAD